MPASWWVRVLAWWSMRLLSVPVASMWNGLGVGLWVWPCRSLNWSVLLGFPVMVQLCRWMSRWWKPQSDTRLSRLVGPPWDQETMWWEWSHRVWSHPGNRQR